MIHIWKNPFFFLIPTHWPSKNEVESEHWYPRGQLPLRNLSFPSAPKAVHTQLHILTGLQSVVTGHWSATVLWEVIRQEQNFWVRKNLRGHLFQCAPHCRNLPCNITNSWCWFSFFLELPVAEAFYILRQCDPSHCAVYLQIGHQNYKVIVVYATILMYKTMCWAKRAARQIQ